MVMDYPNYRKDSDSEIKFYRDSNPHSQKDYPSKRILSKLVRYGIIAIVGVAILVTVVHFRSPWVRFDDMHNTYDNDDKLCAVKKNGKWGFIKLDGWWYPQKIDLIFEDAGRFYDGLAPVCLAGKWGFIDYGGRVSIPLQYDYARDFGEGLAPVCHNGKWGYIGTDGTSAIPFQYEDALTFFEGLAAVRLNNKWGFIDRNDSIVIPFQYDDIAWRLGAGFPLFVFERWGRGGTSIIRDGKTYTIRKAEENNQMTYEEIPE